MKINAKISVLVSLIAAFAVYQASATVIGVNLGTANPPTTLGGYTMTPYEPGTLTGETYTAHETNGNGDFSAPGYWATWGQNYTGFVHAFFTDQSITFSLNSVQAVYFYEEPNVFSDFTMTATDSSGASVTTVVNGFHGSAGIGFYETLPSDFLTSITVTCSDPSGFAIGEFGLNHGSLSVAVPDTGSSLVLMLIGFGAVLICFRVAPLRARC